jgi:hypothetical protein
MPKYCKYQEYCPYKHYKKRDKKDEYIQECMNSEGCNQATPNKVTISLNKLLREKRK